MRASNSRVVLPLAFANLESVGDTLPFEASNPFPQKFRRKKNPAMLLLLCEIVVKIGAAEEFHTCHDERYGDRGGLACSEGREGSRQTELPFRIFSLSPFLHSPTRHRRRCLPRLSALQSHTTASPKRRACLFELWLAGTWHGGTETVQVCILVSSSPLSSVVSRVLSLSKIV